MTTSYDYWLVEPRDTVIFRDARPFVGTAGASTLPFPQPTTFAGFVRSRLGMASTGIFEWDIKRALSVAVSGPWLAELDPYTSQVKEQFFPAPADMVLFRPEDGGETFTGRRLTARPTREDEWCDLPAEHQLVDFAVPPGENPGKPAGGPSFWSASRLKEWLHNPQDIQHGIKRDDLGLEALPVDYRTHVAIDGAKRTAVDGALFQTSQLRLSVHEKGQNRRFAFMVGVDQKEDQRRMYGDPGTMGGERRMVTLSKPKGQASAPLPCPQLNDDEELIRVVLLTPGIFKQGWRPGAGGLGSQAQVVAAAVSRYQPISGWSFEHGGAKPTRHMAPAGSVYWLKVPGGAAQWAKEHHLQSISDEKQDRLDGFGVIAVGRA